MIGKVSLPICYSPGSSQTILSTNSLYQCHPPRMISTFFSFLCFIALYWNALKQPGNATHLSNARCSLRHLGLSLCGQSFYCKSFEETQNVANLSLARVPQRDMVCFCCLALCENALNQTGNPSPLSNARCSLRHLGLSLCR